MNADPLTAPASTIPRRRDGDATLLDCARVFWRYPSPKLIAGALATALAVRFAAGGWGWQDLLVIAALIISQPFSEWLIHVGLLHSKPLRVGPLKIDLITARLHRWHHRHPTELRTVLIVGSAMATILPLLAATLWLLTWPLVLTGADHLAIFLSATICGYVLLGTYEWSHFLIHSPYRPKSRYYKRIWRSHRLHHFKNEHYWFGVTSDAADLALGTAPDHRTVPRSPTARSLWRAGAPDQQ